MLLTGKMGRKRIWTVRPMTPGDESAASQIEEEYGNSGSGRLRDRLKQDYETFCRLSGLVEASFRAFKGVAGQMHRSGLKFSTMEQYLRTIAKSSLNLRYALKSSFFKAVEVAASSEETLAASDETEENLKKLIKEMSKLDKGAGAAASLILRTGLRAADGMWLKPEDVRRYKGRLCIRVRVSKNRRRRGKRAFLRLKDLKSHHKWTKKEQNLFFAEKGRISSARINAAIQKSIRLRLWTPASRSGKRTSYMFRRCFMNNVIQNIPPPDRPRFTLHLNPNMIDAFYASC